VSQVRSEQVSNYVRWRRSGPTRGLSVARRAPISALAGGVDGGPAPWRMPGSCVPWVAFFWRRVVSRLAVDKCPFSAKVP